MKFGVLEGVYSRKDVGVPVDRIDTIAFASSDERKVDGDGFGALVGASEQTVLPDQHPGFDSSFALIVVYGDSLDF